MVEERCGRECEESLLIVEYREVWRKAKMGERHGWKETESRDYGIGRVKESYGIEVKVERLLGSEREE